ncbi:uncharacterized protein LAESUDRAFT_754014 [Laetiporus sulphureus 93-53]|uniref:Uncharacterized protein n=1 Tax=Laetiporus sulphureus 93-53 TaxID=1314785 RepID=A0A165IF06_9APHY|nr:uncharacterized protein LAESUDRAFT_754014 [Laetiporus sulphureus 93-53]KZT12984.1 hypothetical protein LAESUDRAFT_754014 [Laetiporus sulphureus 93-53]
MTALPSFVELMASLGLDNAAKPGLHSRHTGANRPAFHHSRSSSASSCSSFSSSTSGTLLSNPSVRFDATTASRESSPADRDWEMERRRARATRYAPYGASISHSRKRSVPVITKEELEERPMRPLSTSPYLSPATCTISRRSASIAAKNPPRRPQKLNLSETDLTANTPISTFVRRKSPQNSPTSPTFSHPRRRRSTSPTQPVSLPTIPFIFPPSPSYKYTPSDTEDEEMRDAAVTTQPQQVSDASASRRALLARVSDPGIRISVFSRPESLANNFAQPIVTPLA